MVFFIPGLKQFPIYQLSKLFSRERKRKTLKWQQRHKNGVGLGKERRKIRPTDYQNSGWFVGVLVERDEKNWANRLIHILQEMVFGCGGKKGPTRMDRRTATTEDG